MPTAGARPAIGIRFHWACTPGSRGTQAVTGTGVEQAGGFPAPAQVLTKSMPVFSDAEFIAISAIMVAGLVRYIRRGQPGISWLPFLLLALLFLLARDQNL
jgi:hypothetical protein